MRRNLRPEDLGDLLEGVGVGRDVDLLGLAELVLDLDGAIGRAQGDRVDRHPFGRGLVRRVERLGGPGRVRAVGEEDGRGDRRSGTRCGVGGRIVLVGVVVMIAGILTEGLLPGTLSAVVIFAARLPR